MSKKSAIKTAIGIGGAAAVISAIAVYLCKKIFCKKHNEEAEETENTEEVEEEETEDTEEE